MTISHLAYNQLIIAARTESRNMRLLDTADKSGLDIDEDYADQVFSELSDLSERLSAIATVLKFLRGVPNAYINPEAMAAMQDAVQFAQGLSSNDWATKLLEPHSVFAA